MSATAGPLSSSRPPAPSADHNRPAAFAVVTGDTAHCVIHADLLSCQAVVADAYLAHGAGQTVCPPSQFLRFPDTPEARIIALPAHLEIHSACRGSSGWPATRPTWPRAPGRRPSSS
jgi:hypothetical protein